MHVIFVCVLVGALDDYSLHPSKQQVPLDWNLALELYLHIAANRGLESIVWKFLAAGAATESSNGVRGEKG